MVKHIAFGPAAVCAIRSGKKTKTRRRVHAPRWWEGHTITYKTYPYGPGSVGRIAELICARDGGSQRRSPYGEPGDVLCPRGTDLQLQIERVELSGSLDDGADRCWVIEFRVLNTVYGDGFALEGAASCVEEEDQEETLLCA